MEKEVDCQVAVTDKCIKIYCVYDYLIVLLHIVESASLITIVPLSHPEIHLNDNFDKKLLKRMNKCTQISLIMQTKTCKYCAIFISKIKDS